MSRRLRTGGPRGNERLTGTTGALLLPLLAVETLTLLALDTLLSVHVLLGLALLGPVTLKLASTGWRFMRYYAASPTYRRAGPPRPLLRVLAPGLVLATVALFASGVALLLVGPSADSVVLVHQVSFIVWGVLVSVHILAYLPRIPRLVRADWRRERPGAGDGALPGARVRPALVGGLLAGGAGLAVVLYPLAGPWLHRFG